jgi:polysaccharide export outer membrane protein
MCSKMALRIGITLLLGSAGLASAIRAQELASAASPAATVSGASASPSDTKDANRPELAQRPRYFIARSDVITLAFPITPEYNQAVTVQPDGFIGLLGAGDLQVEGMTLPELRQKLHAVYAKILHDPVITVDLTSFQKPYFVVFGQVGKPGQFDLHTDVTVAQAIAMAGGFTDSSKHSDVVVFRRTSKDWAEAHEVNMKHMLNSKNLAEDLHLQSGDIVFVPQNNVSKWIHGKEALPWSTVMGYGVRY